MTTMVAGSWLLRLDVATNGRSAVGAHHPPMKRGLGFRAKWNGDDESMQLQKWGLELTRIC